jgi:Na+/glutamate symporter
MSNLGDVLLAVLVVNKIITSRLVECSSNDSSIVVILHLLDVIFFFYSFYVFYFFLLHWHKNQSCSSRPIDDNRQEYVQ